MKKSITFRGMEHSSVIENYANEQLDKIEKFLTNEREPIFLDVVLEAHRTHSYHQAEIRVKTPDYYLISNYEGPKMYDVLDRVIDVMYNQLKQKKRELIDQRKKADNYKGA